MKVLLKLLKYIVTILVMVIGLFVANILADIDADNNATSQNTTVKVVEQTVKKWKEGRIDFLKEGGIRSLRKQKKVIVGIMIVIFIIIFLVCSYIIIKDLLYYKKADSKNDKLIEAVIKKEESKENETIIIDWKTLKDKNQDIIGWIKIDDTKIDYPILQDKNLYYMNHTYERKYNKNGSIFTKTSNPFENEETIIYGHNMKNKIMLAGIENFMKEEFFYSHPSFMIYTKDCNYRANIFSIYSIAVDEESENIKELTFEDKIEYYKRQSKFQVEDVEKQKNILKLSTCSYINNKKTPTEQRYFLVSFLEKVE